MILAPLAVAYICRLILQDPVVNSLPDPVVSSLSVQIQTSSDIFAGSSGDLGVFDRFIQPPFSTYLGDDNVWFDVGPRAWKLNGKRGWQSKGGFPAGSTITVNIDLNDDTGDEDGTTGPIPVLHVSDIARFRFVKQGVGGFTNAPDNIGELLGLQPGPAGLMAFFLNSATVQSYALNRASTSLGAASSKVKQLSDQIAEGTQREQSLDMQRNGLLERIHFLQAQIVDQRITLVKLPGKIQIGIHAYQPKITKKIFGKRITIPLGPPILVPDFGPNPAVDKVNQLIGADNQESSAKQAAVDQLNAQIQQATIGLVGLRQALDSASQALSLAQRIFDATQVVSNEIDNQTGKYRDLIRKVAAIDVPQPGQWKPEQITVFVNGRAYGPFAIGQRLRQFDNSWSYNLGTPNSLNLMASCLRARAFQPSTHSQEIITIATTVFKKEDISGWEDGPVTNAEVEGYLINPPSPGSDGYVSFDLDVSQLSAGGRTVKLNPSSSLAHRDLRVEYLHRDLSGHDDLAYQNWRIGDTLRAAGRVRWDTDKEGFYEIHPTYGNISRL